MRVAQAEARAALILAVAFAVAAGLATAVPHRTGSWLPLHLFLVGSLLLAISGVTRFFAVTWSAADPIHPRLVVVQRVLVALGAAGLAAGRELDAPRAMIVIAGSSVTAGLALLGYLLVSDDRHSRLRRFRPALHHYLAAVAFGMVGTGLGAAMVVGGRGLRDAHVVVNLLGLVGLVIAGTLPSFTATEARMKMSARATARRQHAGLGVLAGSVAVAATAALVGRPGVEGVALVAYAAGLVHLLTTVPVPHRKQLRWAGPRLVQLGVGVAWWTGTVAVAGLRALRGDVAFPEHVVVALVLGGYLQILLASLAYLGPVLRGGGHERLTAGFATTRSWPALIAANVATVAWVADRPTVTGLAVAVLVVDVVVRAVRLRTGSEKAALVSTPVP